MQRIGQRLVEVRRASGLGVRGFAAAITRATGYEVSHTSVANYESGTTVPAGYAVSVSRTFSVGLPWLLTGEGLSSELARPELENAFRRIAAIVSEALPGLRGVDAEQEAFFRMSPDLFLILNSAGDIVRANPAWDALLGRAIRELERTSFAALLHEDDRTAFERMLQDGAVSEHAIQVRVRTGSGSWSSISLRLSAVGGLVYGVGRWAPPGLQGQTHWRYIVSTLLEDASDLYVVFDNDARCLAANRAAAEAFHALPGTVVGVSVIDELVAAPDRDSVRAHLQSFLAAGAITRDIELSVAGRPTPFTARAVANVEPGVHLGVAYPRRERRGRSSSPEGEGAGAA